MSIAIDSVLDHAEVAPLPLVSAAIPASMTTEQLFVARLKAGDEAAYEELVRTRGGHLLAVARRMLRDEDAARDAVQDAFLSAFRSMQRFDGHAQLSTWLHRIVVNAALMRIRSRQRRPEQSIEPMLPRFAEDGHHAEPVVSWAESGGDALEAEQTRALVRAGIDELPERHRTVLVLRDIDGLSTREVANLLGSTENAVKLRLHRARQALGVILADRSSTAQPSRLAAPTTAGASKTIKTRLSTPAMAPASRAAATSTGPSAGSANRSPAPLGA